MSLPNLAVSFRLWLSVLSATRLPMSMDGPFELGKGRTASAILDLIRWRNGAHSKHPESNNTSR
jgi:hypothetical protein